ncbi:MAG: sodium/proline symporter [Clostridia bacterium]|nr:sodium/proline symporter [Clostridia bacterium]
MTKENVCILISIVLYLALVVGIGIYYTKKNRTTDDFFLGGRRLGPLVTAMSAEASDMSSWLLMGLPGLAYLTGLADPFWTAVGLAVGTYVNWLIVAKPLRIYTQKTGSNTIPDFFSDRFGDKKNVLAAIAALVIIVFFIPYTASGFSACGKLFSTLFGTDYHMAMIISAVVIVLYCTLGGFLAASTSDFIQSIIMTVAIFAILGFGTYSVGGVDVVVENVKGIAGYFDVTKFIPDGVFSGQPKDYSLLTIFSTLAWGLGYFGMPHILLRFMAVEDHKKLTLSRRIASVWVVISMAVAILIGVIGYSMTKNGVIGQLADSETIIIDISKVIASYGIVPALLAGVILAGILAATMSTADSQLLAAASSASQNIIKGLFIKNLSEKKAMIIARLSVVIISVIAVFIAWNPNSSVFKIVSFAWAGFGAAFGPLMLCALFWKRTNKLGALAGMISGGIMVFVWKFIVRPMGGILDIYELLPAFIVSLVAIIVVSLLTKAPEREVTDTFDEVKALAKNK